MRQFSATLPRSGIHPTRSLPSGYARDEWKPAAGLTVNFGLRYDYEFHAFNQGISFGQVGECTSRGNPVLPFWGHNLLSHQSEPWRRLPLEAGRQEATSGPRAGLAQWDLEKRRQDGRAGGLRHSTTTRPILGIESSCRLANFERVGRLTIA